MSQSTKKKPRKPRTDFPLFPHAAGVWAKKVRGKLHYFGGWSDPQAALAKWLKEKDYLLDCRTPPIDSYGLTLRDLANHFLTAKQDLVDSGELVQRSWNDYHATCERVINQFGANRLVVDLRPSDFGSLRASIARRWGPVALGNEVQRVRMLFKYGLDVDLIDKPVRFGPGFKRPDKKTLRKARHAKGKRMFTAPQIRLLIGKATPPMMAMIMLGINCGFGNTDVGSLTFDALDLKGGWINHPRTKTGIMRRCPLWKETIKAIQAAIVVRPKPKDEAHNGLVFLTKYKTPWAKANVDNPVSKEMAKLVKSLGIARPGLNFYALRHTFETIGGKTMDQAAVSHIMGHAPAANDMSAVYREEIDDDRLLAVAAHVRRWLFQANAAKKLAKAAPQKRGR